MSWAGWVIIAIPIVLALILVMSLGKTFNSADQRGTEMLKRRKGKR